MCRRPRSVCPPLSTRQFKASALKWGRLFPGTITTCYLLPTTYYPLLLPLVLSSMITLNVWLICAETFIWVEGRRPSRGYQKDWPMKWSYLCQLASLSLFTPVWESHCCLSLLLLYCYCYFDVLWISRVKQQCNNAIIVWCDLVFLHFPICSILSIITWLFYFPFKVNHVVMLHSEALQFWLVLATLITYVLTFVCWFHHHSGHIQR